MVFFSAAVIKFDFYDSIVPGDDIIHRMFAGHIFGFGVYDFTFIYINETNIVCFRTPEACMFFPHFRAFAKRSVPGCP